MAQSCEKHSCDAEGHPTHRALEGDGAHPTAEVHEFVNPFKEAFHDHDARPGQALRGSSELHGWGDSNLYMRRRGAQLTLSTEHRAAASQDHHPDRGPGSRRD